MGGSLSSVNYERSSSFADYPLSLEWGQHFTSHHITTGNLQNSNLCEMLIGLSLSFVLWPAWWIEAPRILRCKDVMDYIAKGKLFNLSREGGKCESWVEGHSSIAKYQIGGLNFREDEKTSDAGRQTKTLSGHLIFWIMSWKKNGNGVTNLQQQKWWFYLGFLVRWNKSGSGKKSVNPDGIRSQKVTIFYRLNMQLIMWKVKKTIVFFHIEMSSCLSIDREIVSFVTLSQKQNYFEWSSHLFYKIPKIRLFQVHE